MGWIKEALTDGEIDALRKAAMATCNEDTCYPLWRGSSTNGQGECYNIASWLVSRLGGHVGNQKGHYVWLSPDTQYFLDLTGNHGDSDWTYTRNDGAYHRAVHLRNSRTEKFTKRADRLFDSLDRLIRLGLDYGGDAFPAQEPQREDDRERFYDTGTDPEQYWHDEADPITPEGVYNFVYANGQLEISPNHSHDELSQHAGIIPAEHCGPFAAGHVVLTNGEATWEVQANVNLHAFYKILKEASKQYGWRWGGMTDAQGQPITEQFAPKASARILHCVFINDHLYLGRTSVAELAIGAGRDGDNGRRASAGTIRIVGDRAWVHMADVGVLPHLFDWAGDNGLTLYAGNDNVIKTIPDLQQEDVYNPETPESPNPAEPQPVDERLPSGLYRCPACQRLFPNWNEYQKHRRDQESWGDPDRSGPVSDYGFPEPDHNNTFGDGAHYTEMHQTPGINTGSTKLVVLPARTWKEAARVDGFARYAKAFDYDNDDYNFWVAYRNGDPLGYAAIGDDGNIQMMHSAVENIGVASAIWNKISRYYTDFYTHTAHDKSVKLLQERGWVQAKGELWKWSQGQDPKDLIEAPVPFIYDIDKDKIFTGHPGARTSDIPGRFTPGGIVEGNYEPGGKVVIRTMTSVPYTVRHMIELWYYSQPQMEVKSVYLEDDAGKTTKLAAADPGNLVRHMAAADPAVNVATNILRAAGGEVYAVGGAVRDAVIGKEPKDIDLMVTGLPKEKVSHLLESLPGRVDFTGRDFGVFRYKYKGHDVEIALPRKERSTGVGHQDFDVQADHTMKPEDDFYRRDFTANAMGVNLANGRLIDPFGGAADIRSGTLRTLNDRSLAEDPLRVVRALVVNARHGLNPDEPTRRQMSDNAHSLTNLPSERIQAELDKLMTSDNPTRALRLAHETGVLKHILPEVEDAFGFDQNNPHHELELGEHLLNVLERISKETRDPDLRMAALLHDIGKPSSEWKDPETGSSHYYEHHAENGETLGADHEDVGAEMARERMNALRYPNERIKRVSELVSHHMYPNFSTEKGARRFLHRVGDHADDLHLLREADSGGKGGGSGYGNPALSVATQRRLVERVRNAQQPTTQAQLAINGRDLIDAGHQPGPQMGDTLRYLTERVVEDPEQNQRERLLQLAEEYAKLQTNDQAGTQAEGTGSRQAHSEQEQGITGSLDAPLPRPHAALQQGSALRRFAQEEPYFPTAEEATEANQEAYALWAKLFGDSDVWGGVLKPNELESAVASAKNHYYYGPEEDEGERLAQAAAKMGWRIAGNQVFTNGNKRTAYWTMREMLDRNGLGHLSPLDHDDVELADHLVGQDRYGSDREMEPQQLSAERQRLENEWLEMWRDRYYNGQPTADYQQLYPEGTYIADPYGAAENPPNVPPRE